MTAKALLHLALLAVVVVPLGPALAFDCGELKSDDDGIPCEDLCGKDMATYQARLRAQSQPGDDVAAGDVDGAALPEAALGFVGTAGAATSEPAVVAAPKSFTCGKKRTCGQMLTCEEARFHLTTCGVKSLDRDRDGVPCNSLCR